MFKFNRVIIRSVALVALPALFMGGSAIAADITVTPPQATVRFADLNLNNTRDVATLYTRIRNAATAVCQSAEGPASVSRMFWTSWNKCYHQGIADAVRAVHNDKLSAYHEKRSGGWHYGQADAPATVASR